MLVLLCQRPWTQWPLDTVGWVLYRGVPERRGPGHEGTQADIRIRVRPAGGVHGGRPRPPEQTLQGWCPAPVQVSHLQMTGVDIWGGVRAVPWNGWSPDVQRVLS